MTPKSADEEKAVGLQKTLAGEASPPECANSTWVRTSLATCPLVV